MAELSFIDKTDNQEVRYNVIISDLLSEIPKTCENAVAEAQSNGIVSRDMLGIEQWVCRRRRYMKHNA